MAETIDKLKEYLTKNGFKFKNSVIDSTITFQLNLKRKPLFRVGYSKVYDKYSLSVEAETRFENGVRYILYNGKGFDFEGIIYMLNMEISYFKNLTAKNKQP